jgi:Na+-driven multidrug efflux pump
MVLGNVINVVLAILLIFGPGPAPPFLAWLAPVARALHLPRMGMLGAAWATIIARALVLVPNAAVLMKRFRIVRPPPGARGPDAREIRRLVKLAWPSSAQMVVRIAAMLLLNSLVARFFTTESNQTATTALGLVFRLDTMALFVAMGWGSAAQTFVGQNLGAGEARRATSSGWVTAVYDLVTNVGLIVLIAVHGEWILRLFDDEAAPIAIAVDYLRIVAPSYLGLGFGIVLGNAMAGAGATRMTMWIDLAVILGIQFPMCILAAVLGAPIRALFACVAAVNVLSAVAYAVVYGRGAWRHVGTRHVTSPG